MKVMAALTATGGNSTVRVLTSPRLAAFTRVAGSLT